MIQRHLLRQSRVIAPRWQALSRASPSLAQFAPQRIPSSSLRWREASKCYSTTHAADAPPEAEITQPEQAQPASEEESPLSKELEAKDREIIDLKDKYLRSVANFRNLQNITKRDIQTARDYAITKFATDLIESVDNFDRALATVPTSSSSNDESGSSNKELQSLYDGLKLTEKILMQTLKKHGLERFDPSQHPGTKFDPTLHEATFQTKVEGKADGDVIMVQQKGFMLNGRVLRAAKVGVAKNS